ncbi:hypothetical protein ACKVMT_08285 [Halobacteriales archaeon Cl-PHB]
MTGVVAVVALVFVGAIVATLVEAVRRREGSAVVNAAASLAAALLPAALATTVEGWPGPTASVVPELTAWIAVAGFLHSLGMLGLYDSVWWWDHVTHLLSGALVAALVYAGLLVLGQDGTGFEPAWQTAATLTVVFTMAVGVFWELVELVARDVGERLDLEPVLVHYGWQDTALDLVFDFVGAVLVVALDLRLFVALADRSADATRTALVASGTAVVLGSVLMAASVRYDAGD